MGKAQGFLCDYKPCGKFEVLSLDKDRPEGWIKIELPLSPLQTTVMDNIRFVHDERCGERLLKERRAAREGTPPTSSHSTISDELREYLSAHGISGQAIGGVIAAHVRAHKEAAKPGCLMCDYVPED